MPGLNFLPEYEPKILDGSKPFTLRKRRKDYREAALGAKLMMFTGMRTKACRKFATARIAMRATVAFNGAGMASVLHTVIAVERSPFASAERLALLDEVRSTLEAAARYPNGPQTPERLERIAAWDGFASWADMWAFHEKHQVNADGVAVRELFGFGDVEPVA